MTFTATLKDASNGNAPIAGKTIVLSGVGGNGGNVVTDANGKAIFGSANGGSIFAPDTVATGWTYQAKFAGDSLYASSDSAVKTFNTVKHKTSLTLIVSPTSVTPGQTFKVSGVLKDSTLGTILGSKEITFTADTPISIASTTTGSDGKYSVSGIAAPTEAGTYNIQSHFASDSLYEARDSAIRSVSVSPSSTE
jgi:hypothetical protein